MLYKRTMTDESKNTTIGFRIATYLKDLAQKAATIENRTLSNWIINLIKTKVSPETEENHGEDIQN